MCLTFFAVPRHFCFFSIAIGLFYFFSSPGQEVKVSHSYDWHPLHIVNFCKQNFPLKSLGQSQSNFVLIILRVFSLNIIRWPYLPNNLVIMTQTWTWGLNVVFGFYLSNWSIKSKFDRDNNGHYVNNYLLLNSKKHQTTCFLVAVSKMVIWRKFCSLR